MPLRVGRCQPPTVLAGGHGRDQAVVYGLQGMGVRRIGRADPHELPPQVGVARIADAGRHDQVAAGKGQGTQFRLFRDTGGHLRAIRLAVLLVEHHGGPRGPVPEPRFPGRVHRGQPLSIRREGQRTDRLAVSFEDPVECATERVEQRDLAQRAHRPVAADRPAVRHPDPEYWVPRRVPAGPRRGRRYRPAVRGRSASGSCVRGGRRGANRGARRGSRPRHSCPGRRSRVAASRAGRLGPAPTPCGLPRRSAARVRPGRFHGRESGRARRPAPPPSPTMGTWCLPPGIDTKFPVRNTKQIRIPIRNVAGLGIFRSPICFAGVLGNNVAFRSAKVALLSRSERRL